MINCALSVCGTEQGRVSEVYEAKYTGSSSGNSWLLSAQVHNLHCYLNEIDTVWGRKEDKTKEDFHHGALVTPTWSSTGPE